MTVVQFDYPDGFVSYQIVEATGDELAALFAAPDANVWVAANATVTETVAAGT